MLLRVCFQGHYYKLISIVFLLSIKISASFSEPQVLWLKKQNYHRTGLIKTNHLLNFILITPILNEVQIDSLQ